MLAYKISVKIFAASDPLEPAAFVPVFHRWIQNQLVAEHLLIDVADYGHVPEGPSTVLVANEAHIVADRGESRLGLMYSRLRAVPGSFGQRLAQVVTQGLKACVRLEEEPEFSGRLKFRGDELSIRIHDRLLAPNTPETFAAIKGDVEALGKKLYTGKPFTVEQRNAGGRTLFEVRIKSPEAPSVATLLERIEAGAPAGV